MIIAIDAAPTSVRTSTRARARPSISSRAKSISSCSTTTARSTVIVPLGQPGSGRPFYYRMSKPFFHTLIIRSELLIVHEITNGPFRPEGTDIRRLRARGFRHRRRPQPIRPSWSGASPRCRERPHERHSTPSSSAAPAVSAGSLSRTSWPADARSASCRGISRPIFRRSARLRHFAADLEKSRERLRGSAGRKLPKPAARSAISC